MADTLTINDLELWTRIGATAEERESEQRVLVAVEMALDTKVAAKSDNVKQSIDYFDVVEDLKKLSTAERKTIECFAHDAAGMILKKYKPDAVRVTVKKFAIPAAEFVSVAIAMTR